MRLPQERPLGAAVIAVLIGLVGFFTLLGGLLLTAAGLFRISGNPFPSSSAFFSFLTSNEAILGLTTIVLGLTTLAIAVGLWRQHYWALVLTFVVGAVFVVGSGGGLVYGLVRSPSSASDAVVIGGFVEVVVVGAVLAYLASVRDDFI